MIVLLDTNVLLDYLAKREPFFEDAREIMEAISMDRVDAFMAAHSMMDIFYVLRKSFTVDERRNMLLQLSKMVRISSITSDEIIRALNRADFSDVEDCLQDECALTSNADYIVTRNIEDFKRSKISAISPEKLLSILSADGDMVL